MAREHDARQPFIEEELLDALKNNVCTSYRQLSKHINGWCAAATVETWLKSHPDFHLYAKNIKPGLTEENRAKQVSFSKRVHNMWGLDVALHPKILLWIMCDEKWFSGLVPRTNAKACAELGIGKESYSAHHKKHIAKVMVHCTVGFCFNGNVEYGGDGFLIGAHRRTRCFPSATEGHILFVEGPSDWTDSLQGQQNQARERAAVSCGLQCDGFQCRNRIFSQLPPTKIMGALIDPIYHYQSPDCARWTVCWSHGRVSRRQRRPAHGKGIFNMDADNV
jgi:hypothetical protein